MSIFRNIYQKVSYKLSRNMEARPTFLKWYKWFCFAFLKPKDLSSTPIFINNRNHYSYLKELLDWFDKNGFYNYYVIDNNSTYPPLLKYYQQNLKERVIYLNRNVGHLSLWKEHVLNRVKNSFYIYTDADVLPVLNQSPNLIQVLYKALKNHHFAIKAGSAIKIDDLPDSFFLKDQVIVHESQFWQDKLEQDVYRAHVDTTLALYLPNYHWDWGYWDKHIRVNGDCAIRHQPWYQDSNCLTEEQQFYKETATTQTHWTKM